MENYSYTSYPESGDSSPRSREIEFENPPPWEDNQPPPNYKVKFMCSYGGKIHPRPHDNQLAYIGGETKILAVDRTIKFSGLVSKLSALCDAADVTFKYQLPGEDLDSLISVTNDDDLEHMMSEYDRMFRASPKPARLRLFLFRLSHPRGSGQSFESEKLDRDRFVDALNSGPIVPPQPSAVAPHPNNGDLLFGLEKGVPVVAATKVVPNHIVDSAVLEPEFQVPGPDDRMIGSDPIQKHIQDLKRLQIREEQAMFRKKSDDNLAAAFAGDYYVQKAPERASPVTLPGTVQGTMPVPAGYWPEKQMAGGVYSPSTVASEQPVYMIPNPAAGVYGRPVTGPTGQGYYAMQRIPSEAYRDQQVYNVVPQAQSAPAAQPTLPPQLPPQKMAGYSEGMGIARATGAGGVGMAETGYTQVAYDSATGRQVYYTTAPGGVVPVQQQPPPPQYAAAYTADMRPTGAFNQEGGKIGSVKVSQATM